MRGLDLINVKTGEMRNTVNDWNLIMSGKAIGTPEPRIVKVDMEDRDGDLDLTEVIRGRVSYKNRPLSFSFICTDHQSTWADLKDDFIGFIHGTLLKIVDPDTPEHYYLARCTVKEPTYKGAAIMFLEFTADAYPYRLSLTETVVKKSVRAGDAVSLVNSNMPVVPTITVDADITIAFGNVSAALASGGMYVIPELTLEQGVNTINITGGSGEITITYRQGAK